MNPFTPLWIALGVAGLAIEGTAIRYRKTTPGGTLSSLFWRISRKRGLVWPLRLGWLVLTAHLFAKIP